MITELALAAKSEICEKAMDMFVSAYGAEAGNLALKILSVGGLYVGGGIAPRILEKLKDGTFMKAFTDKGRHEPVAGEHAGARDSGEQDRADGSGGLCRGAGGGDERDFAAGGECEVLDAVDLERRGGSAA